jgi:hypothetical protein
MTANSAGKAALSREAAQKQLLDEVLLGLKLAEKGIRFNPDEINPFQDQVELSYIATRRRGLTGFKLPHGITARSSFNQWTPYSLVVEDNAPVLYDDKIRLGPIKFIKAHPITEQRLSTGEKFRDIANLNPQGGFTVAYSSECSLKDKGEDCLFCSINERAKDPACTKVTIKTARQVAEAYDLARKAGLGNHFRITGGYVPERRELEYYLDVAEAIKEKYDSFNSVAIIGAPLDFSIIHKYKEAGFKYISHNIEVWNRHIFAAICPGKEKRNGGWDHWVKTLEHSVEVFGWGNVHSNLVGGLEPLDSALEGIEYLASKGVICHWSVFRPEVGTPLDGYRSPEARWHYELVDKGTNIFRRYGFTTEQMYSGPASGPHSGEVFRIKEGLFDGDTLDEWTFPAHD